MYACAYNYKYHPPKKKKCIYGLSLASTVAPPKPKRDLNPWGFQRAPGKRFCQVTIKKDRTVPDFSRSILRKNYKLAGFHIFISFQWGCSSSRSIRNYPFSRFQRQPTPISGDPQKNVPANSGALFTADSASTTALIRAYWPSMSIFHPSVLRFLWVSFCLFTLCCT